MRRKGNARRVFEPGASVAVKDPHVALAAAVLTNAYKDYEKGDVYTRLDALLWLRDTMAQTYLDVVLGGGNPLDPIVSGKIRRGKLDENRRRKEWMRA